MTLLRELSSVNQNVVLFASEDPTEITARLAVNGVLFERWTSPGLPPDASDEAILAGYERDTARLNHDGRFRAIEMVRMDPVDDQEWRDRAHESREKYLNEHTHTDDEVWFFVTGRACFYLHFGDVVQIVVCGPGDLLSVPVGTRHWFDMGPRPEFCAIRFYEEPSDVWVGEFTGDPIAARMPRVLDELAEPQP
ncbi:cupin [Micromonospora sp. KC606]|uniref:cupin n=1 Tax=Micromonospora sp. KC606 TaxID=2530379 RepID=UPI0010493EBC|nr:cupin [Micromonospora sp. KC606]TDC83983.1 cupin [Micromonospora sp. KC606]